MSSLRPVPVSGALLASSLAIALAVPAHAEEAADGPNIIVIGQREADGNPNADPDAPFKVDRSQNGKFTEPLRDTPKTITAIPKEVIDAIGATSFRDVVRSTPGVTLGTGEGGNAFGDRIFIRGFDARGDVYIDGMRDPGVTSREIFAVEQIEIIKGPSGTFGGRGTTGGIVSLQSKQPQIGRNFAVLEAGVGTDAYYRGTVDANYTLGDRFALRVNGLYHTADTPGRDHVYSDRSGVAVSALWKPFDGFSVAADYYHYRLDGMSDYGIPFDTTTQRPYAVNADNFYGAVGRDFLKNGSDVGTITLRYDSDHVSLRSSTRYGESNNYYIVSVPRAPNTSAADPADWTVATGAAQRHADDESLLHMTDATFRFATGGIEHTLVTGFEISREKITNRSYNVSPTIEDANGNIVSAPSSFTLSLFNPNPVLGYVIPATLNTSAVPGVVDVNTAAVYMIDTLKFGRHFQVLAGVRHDDFDIESSGSGRSGAYDIKSSPSFWNYQASLVYKPVEPLTFYASFSTSSNPSGEQLDSTGVDYGGLANGIQNLAPERNKAYELGAKWEVNHLLLTAAAFQIDKDNARQQDPVTGTYQLVGKLRSRGFELGASGNVVPGVEVFGGFTYLDATIIDSTNAANIGSRFPNVPRYSASLLATWTVSSRIQIGGQAYYQSSLNGGTFASTNATVPGYVRFDAVARWKPLDRVELRLNVLNVTDKRYYDAIYRSNAPFSFVAPGRSATLTAKITL